MFTISTLRRFSRPFQGLEMDFFIPKRSVPRINLMTSPVPCARTLVVGYIYSCIYSKFSVYHLNFTIINTYQAVNLGEFVSKLLIFNFSTSKYQQFTLKQQKLPSEFSWQKNLGISTQKKGDGFDDEQDGDLGEAHFAVAGFMDRNLRVPPRMPPPEIAGLNSRPY